MSNIPGIIMAVVYTALLLAMIMYGVKPTWNLLKNGVNRLIEGPKSPFPRTKSCFILHETAASEMNFYGEIKSESVSDHLETCRKFALRKSGAEFRAVPASYYQTEHRGASVGTAVTYRRPDADPKEMMEHLKKKLNK